MRIRPILLQLDVLKREVAVGEYLPIHRPMEIGFAYQDIGIEIKLSDDKRNV